MSKISVLPLEFWMASAFMLEDVLESSAKDHSPIPPRFNRPGLYCDRLNKFAWFEVSDGRAFTYSVSTFEYLLKTKHGAELSAEKIDALARIVAVRLASKAQREILAFAYAAKEYRRVMRSTKLHLLTV